ncbi:MAG: PE family protein [Mycobacterium sp.]|nr:MAG: PE family protein [Mycobacterium sp.]
MSFMGAAPELVQGAAAQLAGIGSALADATASISGPTTAIAAAAQDEVSVAIASLFDDFGREFHTLSARAHTFHAQFVSLLDVSAGAYLSAETTNARTIGAGAAALDPIAPWRQVVDTTNHNARSALGGYHQALNTLYRGVSSGAGQLISSPTTFFGNVRTALQSVPLMGAPPETVLSVLRHTLGGVTYATGGPDGLPVLVNDAHGEVYTGLVGDGYIPSGPDGLLLSTVLNFASSPLSGVMIGAVGPVISPPVALLNSIGSILADATAGNVTAAVNGVLGLPAHVVDAFFNGATLNLDPLAPLFNPFVSSGSGGAEELTGLSLAFGGLFSPGQVVDGTGGPMYYGVGGSLFNALGLDLSFLPPDDFAGGSIEIPAIGVGPIAATAGLIHVIGLALGGQLS